MVGASVWVLASRVVGRWSEESVLSEAGSRGLMVLAEIGASVAMRRGMRGLEREAWWKSRRSRQ